MRRQAHLRCSLPMEEGRHIQGGLALEHIIDGPRQLMRQASQGLPCAMLFLSAGQGLLPWRIGAQEQRRSFGKGPLEMAIPDFFARRAQAFAR